MICSSSGHCEIGNLFTTSIAMYMHIANRVQRYLRVKTGDIQAVNW